MRKLMFTGMAILFFVAIATESDAQTIGTPVNVGPGRVLLPYYNASAQVASVKAEIYGGVSSANIESIETSTVVVNTLPSGVSCRFKIYFTNGTSTGWSTSITTV